MLVGNRHSEGGIKAVNKSNGQALEMEGGEVVITRNAVSDNKKRMFEGKMMTNREILSKINESGGGVSFAEGGDIPHKCACSGKKYNYGGDVLSDYDIVKNINEPSMTNTDYYKSMFGNQQEYEWGGQVYGKGGLIQIIDKKIPSYKAYLQVHKNIITAPKKAYEMFLESNYGIRFLDLPHRIQVGLLLGNQKLVDNFINK